MLFVIVHAAQQNNGDHVCIHVDKWRYAMFTQLRLLQCDMLQIIMPHLFSFRCI